MGAVSWFVSMGAWSCALLYRPPSRSRRRSSPALWSKRRLRGAGSTTGHVAFFAGAGAE